jgi:hypothetical protein
MRYKKKLNYRQPILPLNCWDCNKMGYLILRWKKTFDLSRLIWVDLQNSHE